MTEQWRVVEGWEGWLEVSSHGHVRTVDRLAPSARESQPVQMRRGALLKPHLNRSGYRVISTLRAGRRQKQFVHVLVARAFVLGWFDGACVDHVDGDKCNNAAVNLEWVTLAENSRRQNADGRGVPKGERHPGAKLSDADVPRALAMRAEGSSLAAVGRHFGVSGSLIHKIENGLRRKG